MRSSLSVRILTMRVRGEKTTGRFLFSPHSPIPYLTKKTKNFLEQSDFGLAFGGEKKMNTRLDNFV